MNFGKLIHFIKSRLAIEISAKIIVVSFLLMTIYTLAYSSLLGNILKKSIINKGKALVQVGAQTMEQVLEATIDHDLFTRAEILSFSYEQIPNISPMKYHYTTGLDAYLDNSIMKIQDRFLNDEEIVSAFLVDKNGYVPTYNSKYIRPLTGDQVKDESANRTKRKYDDSVGSAAANNIDPFLIQDYVDQDGIEIWDISAPVFVKGEHWGAFRIGFSKEIVAARVASLRNYIIGGIFLLLLAISVAIYYTTRMVTRPIVDLEEIASAISAGDLTKPCLYRSENEIGRFSTTFEGMRINLSFLVGEVESAADSIAQHTRQLFLNTKQQAATSEEQAAAVSETSATMEELRGSSQMISKNIEAVVEQVTQTRNSVTEGNQSLDQINTMIGGVSKANDVAEERIAQLSAKIENVREVMGIITQLADQTKLIAFNATLEAAGAGESGKRFEVVANETRLLADRVLMSADKIRNIISEIQSAADQIVHASRNNSQLINDSVNYANMSSSSFKSVLSNAASANESASVIAVSIKQQETAVGQTAVALQEIAGGAKDFVDTTSQTEKIASELKKLSDALQAAVGIFGNIESD